MDGIFISYRRQDASGFAGRLHDRLVAEFGKSRVFMDVEHIEVGVDFVTAIEQAVSSCRVLIVVIGDGWLDSRDDDGKRRLEDPEDFVRLEIKAALARNIRVVPVLEDGAKMPRADELPDDLRSLARRQAITVHHNQWEGSTGTLVHALQRLLGEGAGSGDGRDHGHPRRDNGGGQGGTGGGDTTHDTAHDTTPDTRTRWAVALGAVSALAAGAWWLSSRPGTAPEPPPGVVAATRPAPGPASSVATAPSASVSVPATPGVGAAARPAPAPASAPVASPMAPTRPPSQAIPAPSPPPVAAREPRPPAPAIPTPAPAPREAGAAPATPAPAPRAAAPAPAPAIAVHPGLPQVGQSWTYRLRGKWPTSPNRSVVITVSELRDGMVVDRLSDPAADAPALRRSRAGQAGFVNWPGIGTEFSPYLAGIDLTGWSGRGFSTPDVDGQWTQWHSQGATIGRESVEVPAGRFDAVKVEVWSTRAASGGPATAAIEPVRIHYLMWYVPQVQRHVRMQRRVISAGGQEIERDVFELVARRGG